MRFGIPTGNGVAIVSNISPDVHSPAAIDSKKLSVAPLTASQILNESLLKLDELHISNVSHLAQQKSEQWGNYIAQSQNLINSSLSYIDDEFNRDIQASHSEVQKFIDTQNRLREEERKRRLALEQERLRKEKEEAERKKREAEAEKARQLEEQKRLAEQKKLAEEQRLKKEKESKEKAEKAKQEAARLKAEKEAAAKRASGFSTPGDIEKQLLKYRKDIQDIKTEVVGEMDKDKQMKKDIGMVKRKVNVKLGQLSNSLRQLESVTNDILGLIRPLASSPLAYKWILNFISKAIVSQAETEVTVKPAAALPLGRLACNLLAQLDGLDYFLSARFVKKCCLVIGYCGSIDTEEGRVRMGWRRMDEKWETEVKYEERMGGILAVWAVIGWANQNLNFSLFTMAAEWKFLARLLNADPELLGDVHFVVVCNWWEAAAEKFYRKYGKQAQKVLQLVVSKWVAIGTSKGFPAATRLQILGEDLLQGNKFNALKEMER